MVKVNPACFTPWRRLFLGGGGVGTPRDGYSCRCHKWYDSVYFTKRGLEIWELDRLDDSITCLKRKERSVWTPLLKRKRTQTERDTQRKKRNTFPNDSNRSDSNVIEDTDNHRNDNFTGKRTQAKKPRHANSYKKAVFNEDELHTDSSDGHNLSESIQTTIAATT